MDDINVVVERARDLLLGMDVSAENISEWENIVNLLEMHEEEIRRLRHSINLRIREYVLESYAEPLRKKRGKPE
jgi:hypothetical protein